MRKTFFNKNFALGCLTLFVAAMEIICIAVYPTEFSASNLVYYTVLSNICALLCCVFVSVRAFQNKIGNFENDLMFWTTCLTTFTLTVCLIGGAFMPGGYKQLFFSGAGFFCHFLCPVSMIAILIAFVPKEKSKTGIYASICTTTLYGTTMYFLNAFGRLTGPYFFFEARRLSALKCIVYAASLVSLSVITTLILHLCRKAKVDDKTKTTDFKTNPQTTILP